MAQYFVNGQFVKSGGGDTNEIRNPATGEGVDTIPRATVAEMRQAIDAAEAAFPAWADTPPAKRGAILQKGAHAIAAKEKELASLLSREQGKPMKEAVMEIRRFVHTLEHYAGLAKSIRGGYVPLVEEGKYAMILKLPMGVVGSIVPWNFPVSLMGNKLGPALLAGNTVVVKPADTTPLTDVQCCAILTEAGLPPGVLNCVTGRGSIIGQELLTNPKVRKIGFTGSTDTGKMVMRSAAETIKRVTLELGGSDPMIVCDDADIDKAASAASSGRFFNCGQACLAIKRLYVFERVADEFIGKLTAKVKRLVVGDGSKRETMVGPLHTAAQRKEIEEQVEDAKSRGATVLAGGARPQGAEFEQGHFYLPTLLTDVPTDAKVSVEETFGPVLPVWRVQGLDEAIARANDSIFGLGSSIWTRDLARATKGAEKIQAGYTWINSAQIIYDELPFGGMKQSGIGKEHGIEALDHYMETKSVVVATP